MIILGIETSCDETAVSLLEVKRNRFKILSNIVSSQEKIHQKYGGVVPELAARKHLEIILPIIRKTLSKTKIEKIDYLAVTRGPGLVTSLLVGLETAKTLAYVWQKPIIAVNHLEGHIYANWLEVGGISFPALCLIVSGGHTELTLMKDHGSYQKLGQTLDDAAGEAFDKAAKLLGLGYPGGPVIALRAEKFSDKIKSFLPRPMINSDDFNFSFSGLKTALLYKIKKDKNWQKEIPKYCYEFQQAVVDVLVEKTIQAAKEFKVKTILLAGGVAANKKLRRQLAKKLKKDLSVFSLQFPSPVFCTDNAAMIAVAGYFHSLRNDFTPWQKLKMDPNLEL